MPPGLPFAQLNLTRNPFGDLGADERAALAVTDVEYIAERLKRPGFALQITGDCGRGKTTHLLALRRHFPDAPYIHYPEGGPRPRVPVAPLLFLDETQRFSPRERRGLFRRRASFVLATHELHSRELERAGLEVRTLRLEGLSEARLRAILTRRIEAARRAPGPVPQLEDALIHRLIHSFGDDIRGMEGYLYELFQRLERAGPVTLNSER